MRPVYAVHPAGRGFRLLNTERIQMLNFDQLDTRELRELAAVIKNGLKVTVISPELRVKLADWVMWLEWHCGIDGSSDLSGLPLFEREKDVVVG